MNDIEKLKESIVKRTVSDDGIVFVCNDSFVPLQYIHAIATVHHVEVRRADSINEVIESKSIFGEQAEKDAVVYICDNLQGNIKLKKLAYVVCQKCDTKDAIKIPKLEDWNLLDYIVTNSSDRIPIDKLKALVKNCGDIHSVDNEMYKYIIFGESAQRGIFERLELEHQFPIDKSKNIFDFANALLSGDTQAVKTMLRKIESLSIEPVVLSSVLYKQLRNMILVGFNKNPTEQNTGLSSKQIYAIRKSLNGKTAESIIKQFDILCDVDVKLKTGLLKSNQLIDYLVVSLL